MLHVPTVLPAVILPVLEFTVAIEVLSLAHTPPVIVLEKDVFPFRTTFCVPLKLITLTAIGSVLDETELAAQVATRRK